MILNSMGLTSLTFLPVNFDLDWSAANHRQEFSARAKFVENSISKNDSELILDIFFPSLCVIARYKLMFFPIKEVVFTFCTRAYIYFSGNFRSSATVRSGATVYASGNGDNPYTVTSKYRVVVASQSCLVDG